MDVPKMPQYGNGFEHIDLLDLSPGTKRSLDHVFRTQHAFSCTELNHIYFLDLIHSPFQPLFCGAVGLENGHPLLCTTDGITLAQPLRTWSLLPALPS